MAALTHSLGVDGCVKDSNDRRDIGTTQHSWFSSSELLCSIKPYMAREKKWYQDGVYKTYEDEHK